LIAIGVPEQNPATIPANIFTSYAVAAGTNCNSLILGNGSTSRQMHRRDKLIDAG